MTGSTDSIESVTREITALIDKYLAMQNGSGLGDLFDSGQGRGTRSAGDASLGQRSAGSQSASFGSAEIQKALKHDSQNTAESAENLKAASALYGNRGQLSGATDPISKGDASNAAAVDPWLQYNGKSNAPLTVHKMTVKTTDNNGKVSEKTFTGAELAKLVNEGSGGAAYDFQNNQTDKLKVQVNADGSATFSKSDMQKFTHLFAGGKTGGVKDMSIAVLASGDGYLQTGIDAKKGNFGDFKGQGGGDAGNYVSARSSAYQKVTHKPQWFGASLTS
jgi:hypothetical protein